VTPHPMTIPLWCLLALVVWIVWLVVALTIVRFGHLSSGGAVRDFGVPDDRRLIWRLYRAHQNALENVPLFGLVVLVVTVRSVTGTAVDVLAVVYTAARIGHTLVHVAPGAGLPGNRRLSLLVVQLASLLGLAVLAALPGGP
jgi:uncharacterized MAPEG superfamily protein